MLLCVCACKTWLQYLRKQTGDLGYRSNHVKSHDLYCDFVVTFFSLTSLGSPPVPDPNGDPLHVSPDGGHRPFKPVKEILGSRPSRGCLSPAGGRQRDPESAKSQSSMRFVMQRAKMGRKRVRKEFRSWAKILEKL